jgi:hypothetical protein
MTNLTELTTSQLHRIIAIKEKIEKLQSQIDSLIDSSPAEEAPKKRRMSAAGRARIAAAARARWAKLRATKGKTKAARKTDRRMSRAVRAKLAAIAKARWAKAKAAGKQTL